MAKAKGIKEEPAVVPDYISLDRIARALSLVAVGQRNVTEAIVILSQIGFGNQEVASMLDTTPASVSQTLYEHRKKPKKRPKAKAE